jgi:hypothetical protein
MRKKCYICGGKARHESYQPDGDEWDFRFMCCHCYSGEALKHNEECSQCVDERESVNA